MTTSVHFCLNFLRKLACTLTKRNRFALSYAFMCYLIIRLRRLLREKLDWQTLPDDVVKRIASRLTSRMDRYIDPDCCIIGNGKLLESTAPIWFYVCSRVSTRKYKIVFLPSNTVQAGSVIVSDTVRHNLENALRCSNFEQCCFLLPIKNDEPVFATEAKVSLISNPHEAVSNLADELLKNYFSVPRFLRPNDLFLVNPREHTPEQLYLLASPTVPLVYFRVNSVNVPDRHIPTNGSYIVQGETALLQESNVHSYLPQKSSTDDCSPALVEPLKYLERCVSPFVKNDVRLRIKPIFLVKGGHGSGRRKVIRLLAEKMGMHLLSADLGEVQTLTAAQTEAKLRIVLNNAKQCTPCILCLNNIEVFGKNSEGQKDERIISAFATEISSLYNKETEYPVIVIATCDESDLPGELNRVFIETIRLDHLNQPGRANLISWLLKRRGLNDDLNLSKIAGICSDFRYSDYAALLSHAVKTRCKVTQDTDVMHLKQEDFDRAYEYMQSIYTDSKDAPRVPKVHWEDIGGLAELKTEIMRRIQLPLLNAFGFGQSGLLLYGPPGTGKTLLAKAVATEYQLHFLSVKGPEVLNMYVGQSEKNVRLVFERARTAAPCIIFFDELDSLAPNRGRSGDSGGVMDRVVSQLLAEMDGLESSSSIFIIGATNRPDLIDPALLRPGRFDKMLYVGIHSDRDSQLGVLKALTRKFTLRENGTELESLLDYLPDHTTGADLYSVCSDAWLGAARNVLNKRLDVKEERENGRAGVYKDDSSIPVELEDFVKAARELVPSVTEEEARRYKRMQQELSSVS